MSERKHIVYATQVDISQPGGQGVYSSSVANALANRSDVQLTIICPSPKYENTKLLDRDDICIKKLSSKKKRSIYWHSKVQYPMFKRLVYLEKDDNIDGIVSPLKPTNIAQPIFSNIYGIPLLELAEDIESENIKKINPFPGASTISDFVLALNIYSSTHIIAAFTQAQQWLQAFPGISSDSVSLHYHGVDYENFHPMNKNKARNEISSDLSSSEIIIGFAGSFQKYHRLDLLLKSIKIMSDRLNLSVILVGDGPEREPMEELASELGISDKVIFTGFIRHDMVSQYLCSCDLLYGIIDPQTTGHPMKVYEYLACGRPVIAYNDPELNFIEKQGFGRTVDDLSTENVVSALNDPLFLTNNNLEKFGQDAYEYIKDNFSWDSYAENIVTHF